MKHKLCYLLLLFPLIAKTQSTIQVKNTLNHSFNIVLENEEAYFEESGATIAVANLVPGNYYLKIWDPYFAEASVCETIINIRSGQRVTVWVRENMKLEQTVEMLKTRPTGNIPSVQKPVSPQLPVYNRLPKMKDQDARALAASINGKVFDNDKEAIFRAGTKYNSFTTAQVRELINSFQFEENKLKMAKLIFPQVQDKQNYHQLKDCFQYIGWQSDFLKFLNQQ
ncbi:DUF4476 domain-containing protein [Niabella beijingensis]|uniref:DUF4476 domain-containing protein n=1 Tax=Niabella beijingensis TaxID=2872700 RepID=UPI001CBFAED4|nr:DUF4476 domain-containing protein [Niabella beijingensis]MBZ4189682.1 DUF4476 domain-containing protein [Niabella beijingensis]